MWRSRRKSNRETDNDINSLIRTSSSKLNFIHSSFKDVENLFADDANGFTETLAQPSPSSATARRLSIFHRVHLANKFARAFSVKQPSSPEKSEKSPPESKNLHSPEKSGKTPPESKNVTPPEKLAKSDRVELAIPDLLKTRLTLLNKNDGVISIPGAETRVVVYTTSLRVVRSTFEACRTVQSILRGFRVPIDERDLSMDSTFLDELQNIMAESGGGDVTEKEKVTLPRVFIGGKYIGGVEEVREMHESGELKKVVEGLPAVSSGECEGCGDIRFILCDACSGSHKCYTEKGGFRSCTLCNENGLVRCPFCVGR